MEEDSARTAQSSISSETCLPRHPFAWTPQVIVRTYYFSQGSSELQRHLFRFLANRHPEATLSAEAHEALCSATERVVQRFLEATAHHTRVKPEQAHEDVISNLCVLYTITTHDRAYDASDEQVWSQDRLIANILAAIANRDGVFLSAYQGRERPVRIPRGFTRPYNPRGDSRLSHLCYYGLLGHTTGDADFDALFALLAEGTRAELTTQPQSTLSTSLREIIGAWNLSHPDWHLDRTGNLVQP